MGNSPSNNIQSCNVNVNQAAEKGDLKILISAYKNGCHRMDDLIVPWNKKTCELASLNGHLDCLSYLHEHDCPWDQWTCACSDAAKSKISKISLIARIE